MNIKSLIVKHKTDELIIIDLVLEMPAYIALSYGLVYYDDDGNETYTRFTYEGVRFTRTNGWKLPMVLREAIGIRMDEFNRAMKKALEK